MDLKTLEKREYEARIAKNQIADARKRHEKLAKEMLSQFMHQFAKLAVKFQPFQSSRCDIRHWKRCAMSWRGAGCRLCGI